MEGYKAIGGQKNLKGTFRLLSKGRLIFEWKHFSRLQIQTTKKERSILAVIWLLINYFFSFPKQLWTRLLLTQMLDHKPLEDEVCDGKQFDPWKR